MNLKKFSLLLLVYTAATSAYTKREYGSIVNTGPGCSLETELGSSVCASDLSGTSMTVIINRLNSSMPNIERNMSIAVFASDHPVDFQCHQMQSEASKIYNAVAIPVNTFSITSNSPKLWKAVAYFPDCGECPQNFAYEIVFNSDSADMSIEPCASAWERISIQAAREIRSVMSAQLSIKDVSTGAVVAMYITIVVSALTAAATITIKQSASPAVTNRLKLVAISITMAYLYQVAGKGLIRFYLLDAENDYATYNENTSSVRDTYIVAVARSAASTLFVPATFDIIYILFRVSKVHIDVPPITAVAPFFVAELQLFLADHVSTSVKWVMWIVHVAALTFAVNDMKSATASASPRGFMWVFFSYLFVRTACWPIAEGARLVSSSTSLSIEAMFDSLWAITAFAMCFVYRNSCSPAPIPSEDESMDFGTEEGSRILRATPFPPNSKPLEDL